MKKVSIGKIPMFYYEDTYSYPLVSRQLSSEEIIYKINSEGELKESARIDSEKDGFYFWGGLKYEQGYIEADIEMGGEQRILIADDTLTQKLILPGGKAIITFSSNICALSKELLFVKDSIYTFPDMKKCMSLNLPDPDRCLFEMMLPVSEERYILQYAKMFTGNCVILLVDLSEKTIVKSIELPQAIPERPIGLEKGCFLYTTENEKFEFIVEIYDGNLNVSHRVVLPKDYYDTCVEQDEKCIYFWGEKEGNIWRMNYRTGLCQQIEMPGYNHNWDSLGCINGYAFFLRSPKKVAAFRLKDGTSEIISFKEEVKRGCVVNHKFYIMTAIDVKKDYETEEILRQGEVEIFLLEEER